MLTEIDYCKKKKTIKNKFNKSINMTEKDKRDFESNDECYICNKKYSKKDIKVRDHCHITGKYSGSAHRDCNSKLKIDHTNIKIPIIFQNLRGYDCYFLMQEIGEIAKKHTFKNKNGEEKQMNINVIPNNVAKYMAFMLGKHMVFIDSFQFMSSSLDKLANNLPDEAFMYTAKAVQEREIHFDEAERYLST